jgi:hypothetical protein
MRTFCKQAQRQNPWRTRLNWLASISGTAQPREWLFDFEGAAFLVFLVLIISSTRPLRQRVGSVAFWQSNDTLDP